MGLGAESENDETRFYIQQNRIASKLRNKNARTYTTAPHAGQSCGSTVGSAATRGLPLEKIVLLDHEVVHELDPEVRLRLDVVLHVDHAVDLDVDGEAV